MDFIAPILLIIAAALVAVWFVRRNRGTAHAGDLRPDRPEADIIASRPPASRTEDAGRHAS
jgi:hypothetical protein